MTIALVITSLGSLAMIWFAWKYGRTKEEASELKVKYANEVIRSNNFKKEIDSLKEMYEARLKAKQNAIDGLQSRLLAVGDIGTAIDSELREDD